MMATSFAYESPPKTPPWFRANSQGVSPDAEMSFPHNVGGPPRTPETQLTNGLGSPTGAFERELQKTQGAHQSKAAPSGRSRARETVSPPGQTVTGDDWYVVGPTGTGVGGVGAGEGASVGLAVGLGVGHGVGCGVGHAPGHQRRRDGEKTPETHKNNNFWSY